MDLEKYSKHDLIRRIERLEKKSSFFADMFYNNTEISVILDARGVLIKDVNKSFESFLGYQKYEVFGKSILSLCHKYDLFSFEEFIRLYVEQKRGISLNLNLLKRDGESISTYCKMGSILDEAGETNYVTMLFKDISQIEGISQQLNENNRIFNALLNNLNICVAKVNNKGEFKEVLGAGAEKFGLDVSNILGKPVQSLFPHFNDKFEIARTGEIVRFQDEMRIGDLVKAYNNWLFPNYFKNGEFIFITLENQL